ncbi:MAG TPA: hypothetical protein DCQ83_02570 [Fibrobacteres bacterium]|jgi:hypothetical protein|nr:hypothetical protein [Fibrobacterota bacterium]
MKKIGILLLMVCAGPVFAQNFAMDADASFAHHDFQLGLRAGWEGQWRGIHPSLFAEFEGRPYLNTVLVQESDHFYYQFREVRLGLGPGGTLSIPFWNKGFFTVGGGVLSSFGFYLGSNHEGKDYWVGWLETGFRFVPAKHVFIEPLYRFEPRRDAGSHRVGIIVGFRNPEGLIFPGQD